MEREVSEVDRKLLLKKTYLDKINYHITRNPISQDELYPIVRHFFGEYLKLDYEFTYEELSQELNKVFIRPKVKEHIDNYLIRLSESEYLEENSLGSGEINAYLKELADIIMNVISEEQAAVHEENSLIHKIFRPGHKEMQNDDVTLANSMIDELNFHITSGNLDSSKRLYVDILKIYDSMHKDDKKKLHESLNEVYERLQMLMKNPKADMSSNRPASQSALQPSQQQSPQSGAQGISPQAKNVMDLADETSFYINASNLDAAKKQYNETLKVYESLNPEEKKTLHPHINELYTQIQSLSSKPRKNIIEALFKKDADADAKSVVKSSGINPSVMVEDVKTDFRSAFESKDATDATQDIGQKDIKLLKDKEHNNKENNNKEHDNKDDKGKEDKKDSKRKGSASLIDKAGKGSGSLDDNPSFIYAGGVDNSSSSSTGNLSSQGGLTNITDVGGSFDYSLDPSMNNAQSLADEETDVFRRPLMEDNDQIAELNKLLDESSAGIFPDTISDSISITENVPSLSLSSPEVKSDKRSHSPKIPKKITEQSSSSGIANRPTLPDDFLEPKSDSGNVLFSIGPVESMPAESVNVNLGREESRLVSKSDPKKDIAIVPIASTAVPKTESKKPSKVDIKAESKHAAVAKELPKLSPAPQLKHTDVVPHDDRVTHKLNTLLSKINDDIVMEKLDKAKTAYKEALMLYRSMKDSEKASCYDRFNNTYKSLDKALHQKSLHALLDTHLSDPKTSHRPVISKITDRLEPYVTESDKITKHTTLPMMISTDEEMTRVYELIEESYFNMGNENHDIAMLKYFKALELYHKLPVKDKKTAYRDLYELFKKLSVLKNVMK